MKLTWTLNPKTAFLTTWLIFVFFQIRPETFHYGKLYESTTVTSEKLERVYGKSKDKGNYESRSEIIFEQYMPSLFGTKKVKKGAKIRNRYNEVPHLTQDTNGKVTNSHLDTTNECQEVSPFPAGDHKAHINRRAQRNGKHETEKNMKDPQKKFH